MCLSIAYKNKVSPDNVIMKNVMSFETQNNLVTLTDLMERKISLVGKIEKADLIENYILIKTEQGGETSCQEK